MVNKYLLYNVLNEYDGSDNYIYETIKELYYAEKYSLKKIAYYNDRYPIYSIINLLLRNAKDKEEAESIIKSYYDSLQITQNRCLIISDSHIGRLNAYENGTSFPLSNEIGVFNAYNHALRNGINSIIHLGDLIEGNSCNFQKRISIQDQLEYFYNYYPAHNFFRTYLLYGNHDFNAIMYDCINSQFWKNKSSMELVGVNYSYINFNGNLIKLTHESSQSRFYKNIELPDYSLELSGHSHSFSVYEENNVVKAPSIACTTTDVDGMGFLEMIDEGDVFLFKFFDCNDREIPKREKVIKKRLVKTNPSNLNNL